MRIKSEISANVWKILVAPGDTVVVGQELMILESMKMEIPIESPIAGTVKEIFVVEGGAVDDGADVADIEGE